jgi:hypothetical protein
VIATQRENRQRGRLELNVLRKLNDQHAPVPRLLGNDGSVVFQEDLGRLRLSESLYRADKDEVQRLLDSGLSSLARIHRAAETAGLESEVLVAGETQKWLKRLLDRPTLIGNYLDVPSPRPQFEALAQLLRVRRPRFVKWDARPGNALARDDGTVVWFDWEHCAARNRLDDAAWLLGDEYVPEIPELEAGLLEQYLPVFADDLRAEDAKRYLFAYGTFHMCVRLGLMLDNKGKEDWWDIEKCIEGDKVAVTLKAAQRICHRAGRWSAQTSLTEALTPWFENVAKRLEEL